MNGIYQFANNTMYSIVLDGGIQLEGIVEICLPDGIVMSDGTHIPQSKILFFKSLGQTSTQ